MDDKDIIINAHIEYGDENIDKESFIQGFIYGAKWAESKIKNLGERSEPPHQLLSDVADLKPCPFCGSAGLLYRDNWRDDKPILKGYPSPYFVKCTNDDCDIVTLDGDTEEQVIFRWNRRV